ncbi:unnamed protein product [Rotaria sp. Silwood2]|nr:unnamed protein product [Rotaria sp. Silwood2]CAF4089011.1 unnamed protein product [Rotaria sp. Silwood2]
MALIKSHLLLEENSFLPTPTISKDDDSKRLTTNIEVIHTNALKKEEQQLQKSSLPSFSEKVAHAVIAANIEPLPNEIINSTSSEQHARRTVTFDDDKASSRSISNQPIRTSYINFRLPYHNSIPNNQQETELSNNRHSFDIGVGSDSLRLTRQDLTNLFSEAEYIPGGFVNLDHELEEELLNDFADEFDDETTRRNRYSSSIRSSEHTINVTREPIELWQRARILIAVHLYKIQNKTLNSYDNTFSTSKIIEPSKRKTIDDNRLSNEIDQFDYLEKLFEPKENIEERKITFGLSIIQQFSLDSSQQYQCVDFYDVGEGYIIMCNVVNLGKPQVNIKDYSHLGQLQLYDKSNNKKCQISEPILNLTTDPSLTTASKLVVYPINKKSSNKIQSIEFDCPFQFNFMICIPIHRLILGFINIKKQKSLMIIIGDASRKGVFLSKQDLPDYIYCILYIHESTMLFAGMKN